MLLLLVVAIAAKRLPSLQTAVESLKEPTGPAPVVDSAVLADGRLWLRWGEGRLSAVTLPQASGDHVSVEEATSLGGRVMDICAGQSALWVVTQSTSNPPSWAVFRRFNETWSAFGAAQAGAYPFEEMNCADEPLVFLTTRTALVWEKRGPLMIEHKGWRPPSNVRGSVRVGRSIIVALDGGEYGGGLYRVDRDRARYERFPDAESDSGEIDEMNDHLPHFQDGGLLRSRDESAGAQLRGGVTGLVQEPWRPSCVIASTGLEHLSGRTGSLIEVCGSSDVRVFYAAEYQGEESPRHADWKMPFYRLAAQGEALLALGKRELFLVDKAGHASRHQLPPFERVGEFAVGVAAPSTIFVARRADHIPTDDFFDDPLMVSR